MASVGRNEPCPCDSGKKFKKCCGTTSYAEIKPESSIKKRQVEDILAYLRRHHMDAVEEAGDVFWDEFDPDEHLSGGIHDMAVTNFFEWAVHDARADYDNDDSKTLLELYIEDNARRLDADELAVLNKMRDSCLSLYEVEEVYPEEGLLLRDLLLGGEFDVREQIATRYLNKWDIFAARVLQFDGDYILSGSIYAYHRSLKERLVKAFKDDYKFFKRENPGATMRDYLKEDGDMFNYYWYEPILYPQEMELETTSGEPLVFSKARFEVKDKDALLTALSKIEELKREEDGFVWLGKTERMSGPVILGRFEIKGNKLVLETNSRERLEEGKALILKYAADTIIHKADEFQDAMQAMEQYEDKPRAREDEIPPEIKQQIYTQFMQRHYEEWLTEQIPALGGKTPTQAVKTKAGRDKVVELLKSIENTEEHNKKQGKPHYDISWTWDRLGLARK